MEVYDNEEQQIEAIKHWWSENGKTVIIGLVIGLGGIFGWRYYQDSQLEARADASNAYTQVMENLSTKGAEAATQTQDFINTYESTNYAVLASMQLAKAHVDAGELDKALTQLNWGLEHTKDEALTSLLNLRIARVLSAQQNFDQAITQLDAIKDEAWQGRVLELKGDILLQKGDQDGAREAYTQAQQASVQNQAIGIKLDDLAQ
ncbi:MAG: YfgM family protein [Vibrio sp.]